MTLEEIFSVVYVSTNANNIRRTAGQQTALNVSGAKTQDFIAEKYRQAGLSVTVTSSTVTARLAGTSDRCFFITAGYASAAVLLECAAVLQKAVCSGKFPAPEHTLCFFHSPENALPQEMTDAVGGISIVSGTEEAAQGNVLYRNMLTRPSRQHAPAAKILELVSQINGVSYAVREFSETRPLPWDLFCTTPGTASGNLLKTAAVFAAATAYAAAAGEKELNADLARLSSEEYLTLFRNRSIEALTLKESSFESRLIRGLRLGAWRDLTLKAAVIAIGDSVPAKEFSDLARQKVNVALQLLCDGDLPAFKSDSSKEIVEVLTDAGPECFDGKKTVFETARDRWALQPFGETESWDAFDEEVDKCAALAEKAVKEGLARYKTAVPVSIDTLKSTLKALGIVSGDKLMVHSSYKSFGAFEKGPQGIIQALQESVTPAGIVAMPALSDCCDGGTAGVFDREHTPVEKWVGIIPEIFRRTPGVLRSAHPTHSVCAWGSGAAEFLEQQEPLDCFTTDGPWGKLARKGKLVFLGEAVGGNTFLHACEAWFAGYLDEIQAEVDGRFVTITNYPGGCRGNWYGKGRQAPWYLKLKERGIVQELNAGPAVITILDAARTASAMKEILKEDPAIFLHKSGCRDCARIRSKIK